MTRPEPRPVSRRPGPVAAIGAIMLLAGCSGAPDRGVAPRPLGPVELHETLTGNTLSRSGGALWARWSYAGRHRADGTVTGRVTWPGGEEVAHGTWEIGADGLYCRTWSNHWGDGERGCFRVGRDGDALVFEHVRGSAGDSTRYVYRLEAGDAHDL